MPIIISFILFFCSSIFADTTDETEGQRRKTSKGTWDESDGSKYRNPDRQRFDKEDPAYAERDRRPEIELEGPK